MNIILPLAGISIFDTKHFFYPPPLVEVNGLPLIQYVTDNLKTIDGNNKFIYILKEEDCLKYHLDNTLRLLTPNCQIVVLKSPTKGAVCSILMAVDHIDKKEETIVVNSDQIFNVNLNSIIQHFRTRKAIGGVITFHSVHPRWSYVLTDDSNNVLQAVEKNPISRNAIAGFYYFNSFNIFKESAFNAIEIEDYHDDSLFTSSLLNQLVLLNKKIINFEIESEKYHSFYSPQKIKEFEFYLNEKK